MASNAVVKAVGKKLKYYFEVKRLEDGFDLNGLTQTPRADSAGTRVRQKKGSASNPSERRVKKNIIRQMNRYHYLLTTPYGISVCDAMFRPSQSPRSGRRSPSPRTRRRTPSPRHRNPSPRHRIPSPRRCRSPRGKNSTLPEYFYVYSAPQPRLDPRATGFGIPLRRRRRPFKVQTANVNARQAPPHYVSRGEAERLVNAATKLLVATSMVDKVKRPKSATQSAPRPFEEDKKPRPSTAKYSWDINGRRVGSEKPKAYDDSCIHLRRYIVEREPVDSRLPRRMVERPHSGTSASSKSLRSRSSTQTSTSDTDTTYERLKPAPPPHRPRSAKYRSRTIINTGAGSKSKEEVGVVEATQTQSDHVGIQTEKKLLQQYDYMEDEVRDGEWGEYQIYIRTGNRIGASTRADVKLTLYGSRGRTKEFTLTDSKRHKIPFQKGKEDLFILAAHHVGRLQKIKVGHDRPELSFAWYLEGATIFDMNDKRIYDFPCERWLSGQDGDCRTYRELPADRDRAFIEAFEKDSESDREHRPSPGRRRHSSSSSSASSSSGSSTPRQRSDRDDVSVKVRQSGKAEDSRSSDSDSRSRSSSSGSETESGSESETDSKSEAVVSVSETDTRKSKPVKKREDADFFDQKVSGPSFTFHNKDGGRAASQPDVEYLEGYKAAVEAITEEQMHKGEEERLHEREILKGPTIHQAARSGNLGRIKELLQHFPEMLESKDEHGWRALHLAADHGHMDILKWLTASDSELEAETPTGYTAMHIAAMSGHVNAMVVLAAMGASINCKTMDRQTPLHLAARGGHLESVKWLVANRARVDVEDSSGRTPIHVAEEYDRHNVVEFLASCQRELLNPRSGFAQLQARNLEPIAEDASSAVSGEERWKDDKSESELVEAGSEDENEDSRHSRSQKEELEEKRRLYDEQHLRMEKKGMSFLDSIRQETEQS